LIDFSLKIAKRGDMAVHFYNINSINYFTGVSRFPGGLAFLRFSARHSGRQAFSQFGVKSRLPGIFLCFDNDFLKNIAK